MLPVKPFYFAESLTALLDAEYGIKCLRDDPKEYTFYLRGTLAALKSVPDFILEEANTRYGLGVTLEENLDRGIFGAKAREKNNEAALKFIKTYNSEYDKLMADPKVKNIIGRKGERNIMMHRKARRLMMLQTLAPSPEGKLEPVGRQTIHFHKASLPEVGETPLEVPDELEYCREKLDEFRARVAFGPEWDTKS